MVQIKKNSHMKEVMTSILIYKIYTRTQSIINRTGMGTIKNPKPNILVKTWKILSKDSN